MSKSIQSTPVSVINTVEALLQQAIQLLEIQRNSQLIAETPLQDVTQNPQELMDVKETIKYLGISEWSVRDAVRRKIIPHVRINSRIFFRRRELDQWVAMEMNGAGR